MIERIEDTGSGRRVSKNSMFIDNFRKFRRLCQLVFNPSYHEDGVINSRS